MKSIRRWPRASDDPLDIPSLVPRRQLQLHRNLTVVETRHRVEGELSARHHAQLPCFRIIHSFSRHHHVGIHQRPIQGGFGARVAAIGGVDRYLVPRLRFAGVWFPIEERQIQHRMRIVLGPNGREICRSDRVAVAVFDGQIELHLRSGSE